MGFARENSIPFDHVGAANAAAVAASAAPPASNRLRLKYVVASYSAAPTAGLLTISDGVNVNWEIDMPNAGPLVLPDLDLQCAAGAAITITLSAGGASVVGKVNAYATFE